MIVVPAVNKFHLRVDVITVRRVEQEHVRGKYCDIILKQR